MIAVVGSRDIRIGFRLAGVKHAYKSPKDIRGEKIVVAEDKKPEDFLALEQSGAVVVNISIKDNVEDVPVSFVRQVVGASVVLK